MIPIFLLRLSRIAFQVVLMIHKEASIFSLPEAAGLLRAFDITIV